jgi:hypothetical protein
MERPKDQCPARLHATVELLPPDKEEDGYARGHLFCLSLSFSPFSPLYRKCNPNPPLKAIKGEARAIVTPKFKKTNLDANHMYGTYRTN